MNSYWAKRRKVAKMVSSLKKKEAQSEDKPIYLKGYDCVEADHSCSFNDVFEPCDTELSAGNLMQSGCENCEVESSDVNEDFDEYDNLSNNAFDDWKQAETKILEQDNKGLEPLLET